ncbi:MAG: TMCO4 family protein [Sneathiellales bacterium]|nr:TMCO4 family protein [Sneathiellales bacterium]
MSDNGVTVDVMGHSMGARVILKGLKTKPKKVVRNLFTLAAAVDNECLEKDEEFHISTKRCDSTFAFHSKNDPVLRTAYRIAEFDNALGLRGPEDPQSIINHSSPTSPKPPNVYVANCRHIIHKHGAYKRSEPIYKYILDFLSGKTSDQYTTFNV